MLSRYAAQSAWRSRRLTSQYLQRYWRHGINSCLPAVCLLCQHQHATSSGLCADCSNTVVLSKNYCQRCALPLASDISWPLCGRCIRGDTQFNRCIAASLYNSSTQHLTNRAKHHGDTLCLKPLIARLLSELHLHQAASGIDLILPVPLHPRRLRVRGFNQAMEIARPLARSLRINLTRRACRRIVDSPAQQKLSAKQRQRNLHRSFIADPTIVSGKRLAIVDDVVTTGATANAVSHALHQAGAAQCDVWCLVRTPLN